MIDLLIYLFLSYQITSHQLPGIVTTFAGRGAAGYLDGTATSARFKAPVGVVVASDFTVYVSDNQALVRKISRTGTVLLLWWWLLLLLLLVVVVLLSLLLVMMSMMLLV